MLDVVFVHGLGGDGDGTWRPKGSESWLCWLAEDIPSIAVWSLTYPAGSTKWTADGEGMALPERASNLIPTLNYYGIGSRKTLFVCHSLGGLVVKQILRQSAEMAMPDWAPIAESTVGVAFLATPHSGSDLATFTKIVAVARPTKTTLALTSHCPHLKELGDWYRQNAARLGIETASYAESRKVRRVFRTVMVVTVTSADPGIDGCITTSLDADHIDISKPTSRATDTYRGIETFIRRQLVRSISAGGEMAAAGGALTVPTPGGLDAGTAPTGDLIRKIRELQAMGDMNLLNPGEVSALKLGIVNHYYGVGNE